MVALADWVRTELIAQDNGAAPTPWPGSLQVLPAAGDRRAGVRPGGALSLRPPCSPAWLPGPIYGRLMLRALAVIMRAVAGRLLLALVFGAMAFLLAQQVAGDVIGRIGSPPQMTPVPTPAVTSSN